MIKYTQRTYKTLQRTVKIFDRDIYVQAILAFLLSTAILMIILTCGMYSQMQSKIMQYTEGELFGTTESTQRAVYDVQVAFQDSDLLQEYVNTYGSNRLGFYVMSTQEGKQQLQKYKYSDLEKRIKTKPASIICVYQTQQRDWWIYYPEFIYKQMADPDAYFEHVSTLLNKVALQNSYANIMNYTYELYPDFNEMVTNTANKIQSNEVRQQYKVYALFGCALVIMVQILIQIGINEVTVDLEKKRVSQVKKADKQSKKMEARQKKEFMNEWTQHVSKTSLVVSRIQSCAESFESEGDSETAKEVKNQVIKKLQTNLLMLENDQKKLMDCKDDQATETRRGKTIIGFYRKYFPMLEQLIDIVEQDIKHNRYNIVEFNKILDLYVEITESVLDKVHGIQQGDMQIQLNTVMKSAAMDGLVNTHKEFKCTEDKKEKEDKDTDIQSENSQEDKQADQNISQNDQECVDTEEKKDESDTITE